MKDLSLWVGIESTSRFFFCQVQV